ncbi:MAG: hypothetical protein HYY17_14970 [Planctomycetes bacterium]|nr:hypothetical protein [Planctomycetota bacterium]
MEYWLKENRKFLIAVGAIALCVILHLVLIYRPISAGAAKEAKTREAKERNYRSQSSGGVPSDAAISQADTELKNLRQKLGDAVKTHRFALPDRFRGKGKHEDHFKDVYLNVRDELKTLNGSAGLGEFREDFGFASVISRIQGDEVAAEEALLRLAVADAAVRSAIAVMKPGDRFADIDISIEGPKETGGERFLRKVAVRIRVSGSLEGVFRVAHAFQQSPYLCVDAAAIGGAATGGQENYDADFVVCGLVLDPEKPIEGGKAVE